MKRTVALLLALIALGALAASCSSPAMRYVGYRLSPDRLSTDGEIVVPVPGLDEEVEVLLDEYAIPHIRARSERGLYFALGYMHARDRRFQMEALRMLSLGRMREMIGGRDQSGVLTRLEVFSRMLGLYKDAEAILAASSPGDLAILEAYSDGVNAATAIEPVPMEFRLLDYEPEDWTPRDTVAVLSMVSFGLNKNWEHELARFELILHQVRSGSTIERALAIWKPRFCLPPHLIGEKPEVDPFAGIAPVAPELADYLAEYVLEEVEAASVGGCKTAPEAAADSPWVAFFRGGSHSNNWAVGGKWTGTGKGAFSGDPHMPHQMPSLGYLAHIRCEGCAGGTYEAIGGGFVGLPAIAFGTNGAVAWGATSNWADVADLYVEKPAPGHPGCYLYQGKEEAFGIREEVFKIREDDGTFREEKRSLRVSRHGILINDFVDRIPEDFPLLALKRSFGLGRPIAAIRNLYLSGDVTEARLALHDFPAMVGHWALSDAGGNVAYAGIVQLPRRTRHLGTIPVPGWTGTYEWEGYVPIGELPYVENPPGDFTGSANNQVIQPESLGYPINFEGNVNHRYARIAAALEAGNTGGPIVEQMRAIQLDSYDLGYFEVLPLYRRALEPLTGDPDPLVAEAARRYLSWDGWVRPGEVAPTLFNALNAHLLKRTLEDEVSQKTMEFYLAYFNIEPFAFSIFGDPANPAWDDVRTEQVETATEVITEAFRETVAALAGRYGGRFEDWNWNAAAPFILMHPFGGQKALASHVNRGPLPTTGSSNNVNKHQFMRKQMTRFPIKYGPVLRVNIDFADLPGSLMSLPGGQSGRPTSDHYDDMLPLFLEGRGASMETDFEKIEEGAVGKLVLIPDAK